MNALDRQTQTMCSNGNVYIDSELLLCSSGGRMNGLIKGLSLGRNTPGSSWNPRALPVVCALLFLLSLPTLYAQTTGALLGTVSDQSGAVVPGAKVTLQNQSSGDIREVASNEVGRFMFAGVQPGTYTIHITSPNFKTWKRTGFVMRAADTRDLSDIKLEIGSGNQVVTVGSVHYSGRLGEQW